MSNVTRLLLLIALTACSHSTRKGEHPTTNGTKATTKTMFDTVTAGAPYDLRLSGAALSFCDSQGARKIDLEVGGESVVGRTCKDTEGNTVCAGLPFDVEVRTPDRGPNDVIDVAGQAYPLDGRVHDCAADGNVLGAVTGSAVVLIDTKSGELETIDRAGGERVAIGRGWIAWSDESSVHVRKR